MKSTGPDRRTKDIRVSRLLVAERKFRDVERQIFTAHFVERADMPRLISDQKPSICVGRIAPTTIIPGLVADHAMVFGTEER